MPRAGRWYVLTVVDEENQTLVADATALDSDRHAFVGALPHLSAAEVDEVRGHYLGFTTWQRIRTSFGLPPYPETVP